jgi:hypothetical protein
LGEARPIICHRLLVIVTSISLSGIRATSTSG